MVQTRAAVPADLVAEADRLAELTRFDVLDTDPEDAFDDLARLAAQVCQTPIALVSLVDAERQWFKSRVGLDVCSTSRESSFCAHALGRLELLVVPDARLDPRFLDNPLVTGPPGIRFYAGTPLVTPDGYPLGTLCVLDTVSRELDDGQLGQLAALGRQVVSQLLLRRQTIELAAEADARRQAHRALAESRRLLDAVLSATDAIVYAKDLDGRYLLANPALHSVVDGPADAILGGSDFDIFPEATASAFQRNDMTVAVTGKRQVFTESLSHPDGQTHEYRSTKFPLHDDLGRVYAVAGVSTDVTEFAQQRQALEESERRWRGMVERSPLAVVVVTADGRIAYANAPSVRLYGAPAARDLIGRPAIEFVPEEDRETTVNLFASVLRGETLLGSRHRIRQVGGETLDVVLHATQADYDAQPAVQIELRDITAQHRAETALREAENRWRTLFECAPIGIGLADEHGRFVAANAALCLVLGRAEIDVLGRTSTEFIHPDDVLNHHHRRSTELVGVAPDRAQRIEKRLLRPDGTRRWASLSFTDTDGPTGQTWTLVHVQDITERTAARQAVLDSEANLSAVSAVVRRVHSGADARQTIVEAGRQLAQATHVCLIEPNGNRPVLRVSTSTAPSLVDTSAPLAQTSASAHVFLSGRELFVPDPADHPLVSRLLLQRTEARSMYFVPVRSDGEVTAVLLVTWAHRVDNLDDRRARMVSLLADHAGVALRQEAVLAELQALALTDPLTALPNRRHWNQSVSALLASAARTGRALTIAIADLDHFKTYNDGHGYPAGDELLRQFGAAATGTLRAGDVVSRWGGEEFALGLPNCSAGEAVSVLERIRLAVPSGQTCSIGFATWDRVESADDLMARADRALSAAKSSGRDRIESAPVAAA